MGGAIYIYGSQNITVMSCNIINNTQSIDIDNSENVFIVYNRLFNNNFYDLNVTNSEVIADYNWWGNNTPSAYYGILLNNYFIVNITNTTPVAYEGLALFKYVFRLNDNSNFDSSKLPYFECLVDLNTSCVVNSFDARFNDNLTLYSGILNCFTSYNFLIDNENVNLSLFSTKKNTKISIYAPTINQGKKTYIKIILTDSQGNPLAYQSVNIIINKKTYFKKTNNQGVAIFNIPSLKGGKYKISAMYDGDIIYSSINTSKYQIVNPKVDLAILKIKKLEILIIGK